MRSAFALFEGAERADMLGDRLSGIVRDYEMEEVAHGPTFEVFWVFAFFEPPGRKNAPGAQTIYRI